MDNPRPEVGTLLTGEHLEEIASAIMMRSQKFPDEKPENTIAFILDNIGSRYTIVECDGDEKWKCMKRGLSKVVNIPEEGPILCPNGHELHSVPDIGLAWGLKE